MGRPTRPSRRGVLATDDGIGMLDQYQYQPQAQRQQQSQADQLGQGMQNFAKAYSKLANVPTATDATFSFGSTGGTGMGSSIGFGGGSTGGMGSGISLGGLGGGSSAGLGSGINLGGLGGGAASGAAAGGSSAAGAGTSALASTPVGWVAAAALGQNVLHNKGISSWGDALKGTSMRKAGDHFLEQWGVEDNKVAKTIAGLAGFGSGAGILNPSYLADKIFG